jgi:hypothetical protein
MTTKFGFKLSRWGTVRESSLRHTDGIEGVVTPIPSARRGIAV